MVTCREFSACITVEGKPLPEYFVTVDNGSNKVECWIPSEAGKTFVVHWMDQGTQAHSCGFIYLDGAVHPGRFLNGYGAASRGGVRTGPDLERPFMFADQTAGTREVFLELYESLLELVFQAKQATPSRDTGTIVLKIRLVKIQRDRSANPIQQLREPAGLRNMWNNYISYGKERTTYKQYPRTWNVVPYDKTGNRSYVTFIFKYRPIDLLWLRGIATGEEALQRFLQSDSRNGDSGQASELGAFID